MHACICLSQLVYTHKAAHLLSLSSREKWLVDGSKPLVALYIYIYIYVWQPVARGHRAYTDMSAARVRGPVLCTVCSLVNWDAA